MGLFDQRAVAPAPSNTQSQEVAKRIATESLVLLKNDGVLPLRSQRVAVIGPLADSPVDQMGSWVMDGLKDEVQTPLAAFRKRLGAANVAWAPGLKTSRDMSHDGFAAAIQAARSADVVLLFAGEEQILSGEAHSGAFLNLPGAQEALAAELAATGKPLVTVILAGRPLTFPNVTAQSKAVVYAWHPGTMGGPAIADALLGDVAPSGKLPVTFPRTVGQIPIHYAHMNTGRPPSPSELGIPAGTPVDPKGFTSKYLDVDFTPEYPFGYGLSYTTFEYSNLKLSSPEMAMGGSVDISADVANTGSRDADEIVQLYIRDLVGSITRPVRELKAFRRVHVKAGEKQTVSFTLKSSDLAFYNDKMQYAAEPGQFHVWVAPSSDKGVRGEFVLR